MKFKNSTQDIILEDCIRIHKVIGLNFIVTDGKDVDFKIEKKNPLQRVQK